MVGTGSPLTKNINHFSLRRNGKFLATALILVFLSFNCQSGDFYEASMIIRDTYGHTGSTYDDNVRFEVSIWNTTDFIYLTNGSYWNISGDYQYGRISFNMTDSFYPGSKLYINTSSAGSGMPILVHDIRITHNGSDMDFGEWDTSCSRGDPETSSRPEYKARVHADNWLYLGPTSYSDSGEGGCAFTEALQDAAELRINQSGIAFNKTIYEIEEGETLQVNVTVYNTGLLGDPQVNVTLYLDDVMHGSSLAEVTADDFTTFVFAPTISFPENLLKVEAVAYPSVNEGMEDNNNAIKYIIEERPYLFFTDPTQTDGYQMQDEYPYSDWIDDLPSLTCAILNMDGASTSEKTKANCALRYAILYNLDNSDTDSALRAVEALTYIGEGNWNWLNHSMPGNCTGNSAGDCAGNENWGSPSTDGNTYRALIRYAIAYDWMHNYMAQNNNENLSSIRDGLGRLGAMMQVLNREPYSYGEIGTGVGYSGFGDYGEGKIEILSLLGVIGLAIPDYDGVYQDLDGSPHDWISHAEQDLLNQSLTGANLPIIEMMMSQDGVYNEGSGYRNYYMDGEYYFYSIYEDAFGESLREKYSIVNESPLYLPYAVLPTGQYPQHSVSYASVWPSMFLAQTMYPLGSVERQFFNRYLNQSILQNWGYHVEGSIDYEKILIYQYSEDTDAPSETSVASSSGFYGILRSDWSQTANYAYFKGKHEPGFSGHQAGEPDGLTFDIMSKRAYLLGDGSDERYLDHLYGGNSWIDHNTWRTWDNGEGRFIQHAMGERSQYQSENTTNDAWITSFIDSGLLDMVEGEAEITRLGSYPYYTPDSYYNATRRVVMVGDEYFIDYTHFRSPGPEINIEHNIPFASTEIYSGDADDYDNYVVGNLTIGGSHMPWFNYSWTDDDAGGLINITAQDISEIVWTTRSQTDNLNTENEEVNLTVFLNPSNDITVSHYGFHFGDYGTSWEGAAPHLMFNVSGANATSLIVYYPRNKSTTIPTISYKDLSEGRATEINTSSTCDIAWLTDGGDISVGGFDTDAGMGWARMSRNTGDFTDVMMGWGSYFNGSDRLISLDGRPQALVYRRLNASNYRVYLSNETGRFELTLFSLPSFTSVSVTSAGEDLAVSESLGNTAVAFNLSTASTVEASISLSDVTTTSTSTTTTLSTPTTSSTTTSTTIGGGSSTSSTSTTTTTTTSTTTTLPASHTWKLTAEVTSTFIDIDSPDNNYGATEQGGLGVSDGVIYHIDFSSLGDVGTIEGAVLENAYYFSYLTDTDVYNMTFYTVYPDEYLVDGAYPDTGDKDGQSADAGEISWNKKPGDGQYNQTPINTAVANYSGMLVDDFFQQADALNRYVNISITPAVRYAHSKGIKNATLWVNVTDGDDYGSQFLTYLQGSNPTNAYITYTETTTTSTSTTTSSSSTTTTLGGGGSTTSSSTTTISGGGGGETTTTTSTTTSSTSSSTSTTSAGASTTTTAAATTTTLSSTTTISGGGGNGGSTGSSGSSTVSSSSGGGTRKGRGGGGTASSYVGPTCFDGVQNQNETGIDCGGPCNPCMTCSDGIQNQGEEGVDCGGPCSWCPETASTSTSTVVRRPWEESEGEDVVEGQPTCLDGVMNEGEEWVDCGGPCPPCEKRLILPPSGGADEAVAGLVTLTAGLTALLTAGLLTAWASRRYGSGGRRIRGI